MNRNIPVQVAYDRTNKGVDVRNSSTANFLIDSEDRANFNSESSYTDPASIVPTSSSADFSITKPGQNLLSGFFTRLAMSEIVLNWNIANVSARAGNKSTFISTQPVGGGTVTDYLITIMPGNYTVEQALDALVAKINAETLLTFTLVDTTVSIGGVANKKAIKAPVTHNFAFFRETPAPASPAPFQPNLAQALGFPVFDTLPLPAALTSAWAAYKPNLLAYNYIDITSSQLASQQKVKDATTSSFDAIDVIYRWNFANDETDPLSVDGYGYPILQGYIPFTSRRYLSFPKQIRWDPMIPVGNLRFQTYTDQETILQYINVYESFEFKMLMLVSEV